MAGHNKWSKIKRKKGAKDVARSGLFAKASRAIIVASKACRGDMANLQLQSAIQHAKSIQLPKDRIQDAINKHEEKGKEGQAFQNMRYDAMLTLGGTKVACILTALTDNRNRTASHVRATVVRAGGELLASASHDYLFRHTGMILLETFAGDEEALWECALEAGASEVDVDNQSAMITCEPADLWSLVASLRENGYEPDEFEHRYVVIDPSSFVSLNEEGQEQLESFLDKMDEDEDVTNVYHNCGSQASEL
jgi:YebC/PmpR family DNA-binding regulatory protein